MRLGNLGCLVLALSLCSAASHAEPGQIEQVVRARDALLRQLHDAEGEGVIVLKAAESAGNAVSEAGAKPSPPAPLLREGAYIDNSCLTAEELNAAAALARSNGFITGSREASVNDAFAGAINRRRALGYLAIGFGEEAQALADGDASRRSRMIATLASMMAGRQTDPYEVEECGEIGAMISALQRAHSGASPEFGHGFPDAFAGLPHEMREQIETMLENAAGRGNEAVSNDILAMLSLIRRSTNGRERSDASSASEAESKGAPGADLVMSLLQQSSELGADNYKVFRRLDELDNGNGLSSDQAAAFEDNLVDAANAERKDNGALEELLVKRRLKQGRLTEGVARLSKRQVSGVVTTGGAHAVALAAIEAGIGSRDVAQRFEALSALTHSDGKFVNDLSEEALHGAFRELSQLGALNMLQMLAQRQPVPIPTAILAEALINAGHPEDARQLVNSFPKDAKMTGFGERIGALSSAAADSTGPQVENGDDNNVGVGQGASGRRGLSGRAGRQSAAASSAGIDTQADSGEAPARGQNAAQSDQGAWREMNASPLDATGRLSPPAAPKGGSIHELKRFIAEIDREAAMIREATSND